MDDPIYDHTSKQNYSNSIESSGHYKPRYRNNYTTNITINDHTYIFNNSYTGNFFTAAYCYNDVMLQPYDMQPLSYCFNKDYFVWYVPPPFI